MNATSEAELNFVRVYPNVIDNVFGFIQQCRTDAGLFKLTPNSEATTFSLCFAIFLLNQIGRLSELESEYDFFSDEIVRGLEQYKLEREITADLQTDKSFLQLLCFSLSVLYLLDKQKDITLKDMVSCLIPEDIGLYLQRIKALSGKPQTGNLAMLIAILMIYARDSLGEDTDEKISIWVEKHIDSMNAYGFWGGEDITHLQFQNAYHQYEILEYLGIHNPKLEAAVEYVRRISDKRGQFAPYFGGSGCYDYDAVSIITSPFRNLTEADRILLTRTANTIQSEQNSDGGFSESQWIRPYSLKRICSGIVHVSRTGGMLRKERFRYFVSYLHPKHNRLHTHWTCYSRDWGESNLWDTWFRLQTLARIEIAMNDSVNTKWGFIDFPGIGFYPSK